MKLSQLNNKRIRKELVFPALSDGIKNYLIDGTICDDITFFTSRLEEHKTVTDTWLKKNGFKYHGMVMGKPRGGNYYWVDNHIVKAIKCEGKFTDLIESNAKIQVFKK